MATYIDTYNSEVNSFISSDKSKKFDEFCIKDSKRIKWHSSLYAKATRGELGKFDTQKIIHSSYRPFNRINCYYDAMFLHRVSSFPLIFPKQSLRNLVICVSGLGGSKQNTALITDTLTDLNYLDAGTQCFPLYYYEKKAISQPTLFDSAASGEYTRKDAITDFIFEKAKSIYGPKVTKEDIFYYVYGLLHSEDYRKTFSADLKKMLPRLPLLDEPKLFWSFSKAGRALAELHLNYEKQPFCKEIVIEGEESQKWRVEKMRFPNKEDKSTIQYNSWITLKNIPQEAYDYVVNGRSAIEWIMERYQITTHKESGITNDPNDWATEHNQPRYILDLLLSVVTVSLETMKIVKGLPKLDFSQGSTD